MDTALCRTAVCWTFRAHAGGRHARLVPAQCAAAGLLQGPVQVASLCEYRKRPSAVHNILQN